MPTAPDSLPPSDGHRGRGVVQAEQTAEGVLANLPSAVHDSAEDVRSGEVTVRIESEGKKRRASVCDVIGLEQANMAWPPGGVGGAQPAEIRSIEMDLRQFTKLSEEYKFRLTKKRIKQEFSKLKEICDRNDGKVDGPVVQDWLRLQSQQRRREARKVARSLFVAAGASVLAAAIVCRGLAYCSHTPPGRCWVLTTHHSCMVDDDNSGYLVREEVADLTEELKAIYPEYEINPPLDLDVRTTCSAPNKSGTAVAASSN